MPAVLHVMPAVLHVMPAGLLHQHKPGKITYVRLGQASLITQRVAYRHEIWRTQNAFFIVLSLQI